MRWRTNLTVLALAASLVLGLIRSGSAAEVIDRVIAVVGGELIMQSDVDAVIVLGLSGTRPDASREVVVNQLIDRALVLTEIERYSPPEPLPTAIDAGVQAIRGKFPTRDAFDAALARVGFTERRLQQTVRQDLRIDAYVQQRFTTPVPNDEEIAAYYETHRNQFSAGGRQLTVTEARDQVAQAIRQTRHATLVAEWIGSLRRRATIMRVGAGSL